MTKKELIEKFLCVGCVCGKDTNCGAYKPNPGEGEAAMCDGHVLGTIIGGIGNIALGLPKGFNRPGWCFMEKRPENKMLVRLWPAGSKANEIWDWLNIPVWSYEEDGFLFVRTYLPRRNYLYVDVIEGGKARELCPQAINITSRMDDID